MGGGWPHNPSELMSHYERLNLPVSGRLNQEHLTLLEYAHELQRYPLALRHWSARRSCDGKPGSVDHEAASQTNRELSRCPTKAGTAYQRDGGPAQATGDGSQ